MSRSPLEYLLHIYDEADYLASAAGEAAKHVQVESTSHY